MAKTWKEKRDCGKKPIVKILDKDFADMKAGQRMLVPNIKIIEETIMKIPTGKSLSVASLRQKLAKEQGADTTCPVTTGINLRICAEAAMEDLEGGRSISDILPFWRVLDKDTSTTKKLSFDAAFITEQREREGLV